MPFVFVQSIQTFLLWLGQGGIVLLSQSKKLQLLFPSRTIQRLQLCLGGVNTMHQDPFRERSLIRLFLTERSRPERYKVVVEMIVKSTKLHNKNLSFDRARFFDAIQDDLWLSSHSTKGMFTDMKRQFKTQWSYADIDLDHDQREDFTKWMEANSDAIFEQLPLVLADGYKLSVVYKPEREAWIATLTGMPDAVANVNVSMSSFHQTVEDALGLALYKHVVIANGGDWGLIAKPDTWG